MRHTGTSTGDTGRRAAWSGRREGRREGGRQGRGGIEFRSPRVPVVFKKGRSMMRWLAMLTFGFGIALTSCDTVDEAFDCQAVCSRYRDCYDANYDVGQCRANCRARAANDSSVKAA